MMCGVCLLPVDGDIQSLSLLILCNLNFLILLFFFNFQNQELGTEVEVVGNNWSKRAVAWDFGDHV